MPSIAVVRVKSDHNKHEFACVTLAAETLQEETAFFTVLDTQDKSTGLERDLQIIRPLLAHRVWFGFDLQQTINTLQRLYDGINQASPQGAGFWEGSQMFEEAFSQSCNSLLFAAQHLRILPRNKRSLNARAECDITCEIFNQLSLNWTTRPNQSVTSPSSEDQLNKNQERIENQNESFELKEEVSHEIENANVVTTNNVETIQQGFNSATGHGHSHSHSHGHSHGHGHGHVHVHGHGHGHSHGHAHVHEEEKDIQGSPEKLNYHHHSHHNPSEHGHTSTTHKFHDSNTTQHSNEETNRNTNNEQFASVQTHNLNQEIETATEDVHIHKDVKHSDSKVVTDDHATERDNRGGYHGSVPASGQASWKDLAKGKQTPLSSRPSQLHVIPGIVQKKPSGQGRYKQFPPARDQLTIKQLIGNAISGRSTVWISYDGGNQPLVPRGVNPTRWETESGNVAFFGVPFRSKTGNETKFILRQVKEVRERFWQRPEDANTNSNRGASKNETKNERGGEEKQAQGASKHEEASKDNGNNKTKTNGHNKPRSSKPRK